MTNPNPSLFTLVSITIVVFHCIRPVLSSFSHFLPTCPFFIELCPLNLVRFPLYPNSIIFAQLARPAFKKHASTWAFFHTNNDVALLHPFTTSIAVSRSYGSIKTFNLQQQAFNLLQIPSSSHCFPSRRHHILDHHSTALSLTCQPFSHLLIIPLPHLLC
jgi:hypothetical protein